jgi:DNA/RNA endonuclease YhcR with UshA esterase domain
MRVFATVLVVVVGAGLRAEEPAKPITPAEAAKKVNEKVVVEMEVKSTGGRTNCYLNSEADYRDAKNFTVFIPEEAVAKFKAAKIEDPKVHYKGKLVRVTGTVTTARDKPQIKVESPDQIVVVEKK